MESAKTILDNHRSAANLSAGVYRVHVKHCSCQAGHFRIEAGGAPLADLNIGEVGWQSNVVRHPGGMISLICDPGIDLSVEIEIPL